MKIIKNNITKILLGVIVLTSFSSCDEGGDPNPGGTTTGSYAGDWYITLTDSDGDVLTQNELHHTYNTSANDNTMWIDDAGHGYGIKCKITVDLATGTFSAVSQPNLETTYDPTKPTTVANDPVYATDTVTITDGKIEKGTATSLGGHKVDKISFKAHFSYDPAAYLISYEGHKRTGFLEDEY